MTERRLVTQEVFDFAYSSQSMPLGEFVKMVNDAYENVPAEFRDKATFVYEHCSGEWESSQCKAEYVRPETDAEVAVRIAWNERYERERLASEAAQYRRLKAKFEPAS